MQNSFEQPKELKLTEIKVNEYLNSVKVESITKIQTFGRRFKVQEGDAVCEAVFHDLFKTAQRMVHEAKKPDDLKKVQTFIEELKTAGQIADQECDDRCQSDTLYKILTFFSRIGNIFHGLGSHTDRLNALELQIKYKEIQYEIRMGYLRGAWANGKITPAEKYELALEAYQKETPQFIKLMKGSADEGYLPAQKYLGDQYLYGKDTGIGYHYYELAAEQGDIDSAFRLLSYNLGEVGIGKNILSPQNKVEALKYCAIVEHLLKSYSGSDKKYLMDELKRIHSLAERLPDDLEQLYQKALANKNNSKIFASCMTKAAVGGHILAQREMGQLCFFSYANMVSKGQEDIEFLAAGVEYYTRAAQKGDIESAKELGRYYLNESSPLQEPLQALKYWQLAKTLTQDGESLNVIQRYIDKAQKTQETFDHQHQQAIAILQEPSQDQTPALELLENLSKKGHLKSLIYLGNGALLSYRSDPQPKLLENSLYFYDQAARRGDLEAIHHLINYYQGNIEIGKDKKSAIDEEKASLYKKVLVRYQTINSLKPMGRVI